VNTTMHKNTKDISNKRFGMLVAKEPTELRQSNKFVIWKCICDCGNEHYSSSHDLISGSTRSCGCLQKSMARERIIKPKGESSFNNTYNHYKYNAKKRGLVFTLDKKQFSELTKQNCFYCGKEPSNVNLLRKTANGSYTYNGLDRINSLEGYTIDNVITCCWECNKRRGTSTQEEMYSWIVKVYNYMKLDSVKGGL
jgi:hypothetical protein